MKKQKQNVSSQSNENTTIKIKWQSAILKTFVVSALFSHFTYKSTLNNNFN